MSNLIIEGRVITTPIIDILYKVRSTLTNGKLSVIEQKDDYVRVTCPQHADGKESHPSCSVYCGDGELPIGTTHCFTCDLVCNFVKFLSLCFDSSYDYAKNWLLDNYGDTYLETDLKLDKIEKEEEAVGLHYDDDYLLQFEDYHPYMTKRGLSDAVIKKYEIKYDPLSKAIVFPIRNLKGELVGLTKRCTDIKKFYIDKGFDKRNIYLLYNVLQDNARTVYVCESQINALVLQSWGYQAIALIGCGTTQEQIDILNTTPIRHYVLCYDGDDAGRKGAAKFCKLIRKDVFVDVVNMPDGKDVGDLTKYEFEDLVYKSSNL